MTEQSITSDEFQRFQDQLIALKEAKYRLEEKNELLQRQYNEQANKLVNADREIARLNEFKNRSKNSRDIDMLINENETLRERFTAIESNFKLQTEVLKSECEHLLSENHRLKSQLDTFSNGDGPSPEISNIDLSNQTNTEDDKYQIRLLQIEITKIIQEKNILQEKIDENQATISNYKISDKELSQRVDSLLSENNKHLTTIQSLKSDIDKLELNNSDEFSRLKEEHELTINKVVEDKDKAMDNLKSELENEYSNKNEVLKNECELKISDLNTSIEKLKKEIVSCKYINKNMSEGYEKRIKELQQYSDRQLNEVYDEYETKLSVAKNEKWKLEEDVSFLKEELKVVQKKNSKLLKDMKKQLEKEVKLTQDTQSKLAEAIIQRGSQLNSQSVWSNSRGQLSNCGGDDSSSVYSWSNNGILSDSQNGSSGTNGGNIPVTDDELKSLLDKVAESQSELGETRRFIEYMENEKRNLSKTIDKQQRIINKYINRGPMDNLTVDNKTSKPSTSSGNAESRPNSSSNLTLNGLLPSSSEDNTASLISRVKATLKTLSNEVLLQTTAASGGPVFHETSVTRVTKGEVKQLQRVCEELMMRCLNLESDLQASIDMNVKLQQALAKPSPDPSLDK